MEQILAIPSATPEEVDQGEVTGAKRDAFEFKGAPAGKYDLVAIFDGAFYEGLKLSRERSTLTPEDLKKIEATIESSEPFFLRKTIHRVEGQTGRGNLARCICTFLRDKGSDLMMEQYQGSFSRADFWRTYKLVMLKDVGPGWQVVRARDLYPVWMNPKHALPVHHFRASLSDIRVADEIKDLGALDLSRSQSLPQAPTLLWRSSSLRKPPMQASKKSLPPRRSPSGGIRIRTCAWMTPWRRANTRSCAPRTGCGIPRIWAAPTAPVLNGAPVHAARLSTGDMVKIGSSCFVFLEEASAGGAAPHPPGSTSAEEIALVEKMRVLTERIRRRWAR